MIALLLAHAEWRAAHAAYRIARANVLAQRYVTNSDLLDCPLFAAFCVAGRALELAHARRREAFASAQGASA